MANQLDQDQLSQIVAAVLNVLKVQGAASTKPAPQAGNSLETKDRALVAGLKRKGIALADIQLMDRNDPKKPFNVKPYRLWLEQGRQVRKGEKGIRGLFHLSQTDVIAPAKPSPKAKGKPASAKLHSVN